MIEIIYDDCYKALRGFRGGCIDLIYTDPPYNTGRRQKLSKGSYSDSYSNFHEFMVPVLEQMARVIKDDGSIFLHLDYREVHYVKVWMDKIMGREAFQGEIIWHFETGGSSKSKWSNKHQTILWYSQDPRFYFDEVPTLDRKAPKPGYEGEKKWSSVWNINMSTTDPQRTGYPTQKPELLVETLVKVHTLPGDTCLDAFAGSGTLGAVCSRLDRDAVLIDSNSEAINIMRERIRTSDSSGDLRERLFDG